jgi:hypothetical protein
MQFFSKFDKFIQQQQQQQQQQHGAEKGERRTITQ